MLLPQPPLTPSAQTQLGRVRRALIAMFGLFGVVQTSWMGRLPSVRESLDITAGQLGTVLVAGAIGSLAGVMVIGPVIVRLGSAFTLRTGMVGALGGFALVGAGTATGSLTLFTVGVLVNGLAGPATNIPINLETARVEQRLGKAVLPHVHAAFSVGALFGGLAAATTSVLHVDVAWHIVGVAGLVTAGRALLISRGTALQAEPTRAARRRADAARWADPGADLRHTLASVQKDRRAPGNRRFARRGASAGGALRAWTEPRTLLIGLVLLAATMSEGAASNWLNLAVVDGFGTREAVGALAYGTFVVSMLAVRLFGAGLIDKFGRVAVLRVSGVSALLGLLVFGLGPSLPLAWAGIVLWGAGAALAYPVGTAAAADDPSKAAARVSVVGSFGSIASLSAPPVLGLLADSWGTRHALLTITLAMVVSLAAAGHVRPERHGAPHSEQPAEQHDGDAVRPALQHSGPQHSGPQHSGAQPVSAPASTPAP